MSDSSARYSAADIVLILQAAQDTNVLAMTLGDVSFQRQGYIEPAVPLSPNQELKNEVEAAQVWMTATPPDNILGTP